MADELSGAVPAPASGPCCAKCDEASSSACILCAARLCKNCVVVMNLKKICIACRDKILEDLRREVMDIPVGRAALAGIAAAVVAGAAWALIAVVTNSEIGFAAVGVGFLAGKAVVLGAGNKRGPLLQRISLASSVAGLVLGKYFIVAHIARMHSPATAHIGYLDARMMLFFVRILPRIVSPFDFLWLFIALRAAWRVPAPARIMLSNETGQPAPAAPAA